MLKRFFFLTKTFSKFICKTVLYNRSVSIHWYCCSGGLWRIFIFQYWINCIFYILVQKSLFSMIFTLFVSYSFAILIQPFDYGRLYAVVESLGLWFFKKNKFTDTCLLSGCFDSTANCYAFGDLHNQTQCPQVQGMSTPIVCNGNGQITHLYFEPGTVFRSGFLVCSLVFVPFSSIVRSRIRQLGRCGISSIYIGKTQIAAQDWSSLESPIVFVFLQTITFFFCSLPSEIGGLTSLTTLTWSGGLMSGR